jgi:hypothetical protein
MILQNTVFIILALSALVCTVLSIKGQRMIMDTHYKVLELIKDFRKELHQAIEEALFQHIQEYHK